MQYISSFFKYLEFEKRCSKHTLITYECDLRQFSEYLSEQHIPHCADVTPKDIRQWMVQLLQGKVAPVTVHRKISALKSFYRFLMREQLLEANPAEGIVLPKVPKKLPVFVKEGEMDLLLDQIPFSSNFDGSRDKLMIATLYATGMRLSELVELRLSNINVEGEMIKVLGKRNKERLIPFYVELKTLLQEYLLVRKETFPDVQSDILLLTSKGKPVYPKLIYRVVNKYIGMVSTIQKKSPHVIRHSFATALLNRGADLNAIKELLGHANLAATEIYTHNSFEKLNSIYKQAHPRA
jgi:integrase/recombinase XerC